MGLKDNKEYLVFNAIESLEMFLHVRGDLGAIVNTRICVASLVACHF